MPASHTIVYYRNYSAADTASRSYTQSSATFTLKSVDETGWSAPDGYAFKEWNSLADGTGLGRDPGDTVTSYKWYAIWEQDTAYLTAGSELESVADAIRAKGGTSAALTYPAGFVSAIQAIPTGITPTGTISITENGTVDVTAYASASVNVSGGVVNTCTVTIDEGGVTCSGFSHHTPTGSYVAVMQLESGEYPFIAAYFNTTTGNEGFAMADPATPSWAIQCFDPHGWSYMAEGSGGVEEDPYSGLYYIAETYPGPHTATVIEF